MQCVNNVVFTAHMDRSDISCGTDQICYSLSWLQKLTWKRFRKYNRWDGKISCPLVYAPSHLCSCLNTPPWNGTGNPITLSHYLVTILSVASSHVYRSALVGRFLESFVSRVSDNSLYQSLVWLFGWGDGPTFAIFLLHIIHKNVCSKCLGYVLIKGGNCWLLQ